MWPKIKIMFKRLDPNKNHPIALPLKNAPFPPSFHSLLPSPSKVSSLQADLDNSVAVQNDFVRLSQSLQVTNDAKKFTDPVKAVAVLYEALSLAV